MQGFSFFADCRFLDQLLSVFNIKRYQQASKIQIQISSNHKYNKPSMEISEQDWELINDDGFIYRRLKRQRLDSTTAPPPDLAVEAKTRRERKKKVLLNLKTMYQQEIHHREHLSNTLKALQDITLNQPPPAALPLSDHTRFVPPDSTYRELIHTLLTQVEAQGATVGEISRFCDVAEDLCDAEELRWRQLFSDLSIWEPSPRKLVTLLLEE